MSKLGDTEGVDEARRRWRGLLAGGVVAALGGLAVGIAARLGAPSSALDCTGSDCPSPEADPGRLVKSPQRAALSEAPDVGPHVSPGVVWDIDVGAVVFAPITVARGPSGLWTAFAGTLEGRIFGIALEGPSGGEVVVEATLGGMVWGQLVSDGGGTLYVGADDDRLHALAVSTGDVLWSLRLGDCEPPRGRGPEGTRCDVDGGPIVGPDGDVYVGADGVYRIGPSGEIRWHYTAGEPSARHVYSRPAVTDEQVVFGGQDGFITAVDRAGGAERWRVPVGPDVDGGAVVGTDGTIYIGADDGKLYSLTADGEVRWVFASGAEIRSRPVVTEGGEIYVGSFDGNFYRVTSSGDTAWVLPTGQPIMASPRRDADGWVYFGARDGRLYAVTPDDEVGWSVQFPADIDSDVAFGPSGMVVVGCDDGHVRVLR